MSVAFFQNYLTGLPVSRIESFIWPFHSYLHFALFLVYLGVSGISYHRSNKKSSHDDPLYSEHSTFGSAHFMKPDALRKDKDLDYKPLEETKGIILGVMNGRIVSQSPKTLLNRNILSLGKAGSGKSTGFIIPYIYQSIKSGESLIVVDTKGDLYKQTSFYALVNGYKIRVLNCKDPDQSDSWNVFDSVSSNEEIWRVAEEIFECTHSQSESQDENSFWERGAKLLLCACIHFIIHVSDQLQKREFADIGHLYQLINGFKINESSTEYLKNIFLEYVKLFPQQPGTELYKSFNATTNEVAMSSHVQNLLIRLARFQNPAIQKMLSHSSLDLVLPLKKKCIYYLNLDEQNYNANFAIRLFLRELLINLIKEADKNTEESKIPVTLVLDEFGAIGTLPDFDKFISTSRSRNIRNILAFQNVEQIRKYYPEAASTIMGNCDIWQVTGVNEFNDAKLICDMIGQSTVNSHSKSIESLEMLKVGNNRESISDAQRNLLNPSEIMELPREKCLVLISHKSSLILDKIKSWEMPENNFGEKLNIYNYKTDRKRFKSIRKIKRREGNERNFKNILGFNPEDE